MPLSRHKITNEFSLGGRELYRKADQHDPEAVLDGVAMAGLTGVLRQLGDLAEFAAEVFNGLHDEIMSASARGHGLMLRVQQLEAELPLMEKDFCQRDSVCVASNRGADWHANVKVDHGLVTRGDTPHFIMESIKQCHGPPKLFMLDKYDIGGAGACLKRYTDPSFFKTDSASSSMLQEGIQREKRPLKVMEIRPNLQNSEIFKPPNAASNDSKLETHVSGEASDEIPSRRRRLKYRQLNGSVFRNLRPEMKNLYEKASSEEKAPSVHHLEVQISFTDSPDSNTEVRDIVVDASGDKENRQEDQLHMVPKERSISEEALSRSSDTPKSGGSSKGYSSEVDTYVDALTTMEYEVETDSEHRDQRHLTTWMESGKTCSKTHNAAVWRSSSFGKKDSPMPYYSDAVSVNGDKPNHQQEDIAAVSILQAKHVAGEHERTSSLEKLFAQEKPVACEHERTSSLDELLTGDVRSSGPDMRELATESNCNGNVSHVISDGTLESYKKAKESSNIATISFKKIASKRSKYVGSVELITSKIGNLPRKLSKKHDLFSDSLRNMAKQLLELKYDGTQDTASYDFEANSEGLDLSHPLDELDENVMQKVPSDSARDDDVSRECQPEELKEGSEHAVAPTDSPQESPPKGNGLQDTNIVYLTDTTTSSSQEEEVCGNASASDVHSSPDMLDHESMNRPGQTSDGEVTEDAHTEDASKDASHLGEELEEGNISGEQANSEDAEECNVSDAYALDDESTEYREEQAVSDGVICSPISSKQSDDPCWVTPLALTNADASDGIINSIAEMDHIPPSEKIAEIYPPTAVTELVVTNNAAVPDNGQYCSHLETAGLQNTVVGSYEVVGQHEQISPCTSSMTVVAPKWTVSTEELHESCQHLNQESPYLYNRSNTEICEVTLAPGSRDLPLPDILSFDWMLNGAMQQSLNVLPAQPAYGMLQENGCHNDTEDVPPLPPLPPMQWRASKLQTGSAAISTKLGRPPRPKPPVKQPTTQNSSLDERNQEVEMLQARIQHDDLTLQKEMTQATLPNEIQTNPFLEKESEEINSQEGFREYEVQTSNPFSASEVKNSADVLSVEGENLKTLELSDLMVIPEEAWSELVYFKAIPKQELSMQNEGTYQLSNGVSDCNNMHTPDLSTEKLNEEHESSGQKEKEFSAAGSNTVAASEISKPSNGVPRQDDMQNPDLSTQQEYEECGSSNDKAREFSSALEEEIAKYSTHPMPKPPTYPLLRVTSHDRSMLRQAPTLVQPSSKLSDERNTMLEQIKNKSFNLKPVLSKRPNVMGAPRTNLKVVAILERANAIRQAVADEDDEDSWSE